MVVCTRLAQLTDIFRTLKADTPEQWARSEVEEGIPQLARFLFLRMAWRCITGENDVAWIDATIHGAERYPNGPGAGAGFALQWVLAQGVSRQDITDIVRVKQYEALFALCYGLDDPDFDSAEIGAAGWALIERNYDGNSRDGWSTACTSRCYPWTQLVANCVRTLKLRTNERYLSLA